MIAAIIAAASLTQTAPSVDLDYGLGLMRACEQESTQLLCLGYIKGLTDGLEMYSLALGRPRMYCPPPTITMGDFQQVIVEDLRVRRDLWADLSPGVVVLILREAFPCPTSGE